MKKVLHKAAGLLTALLVTVGAFAPTMVAADVEIQPTLPDITVGTSGNTTPTKVGFAGRQWVVIGYNGDGVHSEAGTMTLLARGDSFGVHPFNPSTKINEYNGSALQTAINGIANSIGAGEQRLIQPRTLEGGSENYEQGGYDPDKIRGVEVTDAILWLLSVSEAEALDNTVRTHSNIWWLRSPGNDTDRAAVVNFDGAVGPSGIGVDLNGIGVRPAFTINLESVLFTSAADAGSGKSNATVGDGLVGVTTPTGALKFTMLDESMATPAVTLTGEGTGTLSFDFADAQTGTDQYLSCVVEQGGEIKYYAKLFDCDTLDSGSFTIDLTGLDGVYMLKVFSEQANGDGYTDFAGAAQSIPFTVASGNGTIDAAPVFTTQPQSAQYVENNPANPLTVEASATGTTNLSYQWYSNTEDNNTTGTEIPGETGTSYTPPATTPGTLYYYAVATNTVAGKTESTASDTAEILVWEYKDAETPAIVTQPQGGTCYVGDTVTLSVEARSTDSGSLTYQWYTADDTGGANPQAIPSETSATYTPPTDTAGEYHYYVAITNENTSATGRQTASINSKVAALTVQAAPTPPPVESKPSGASTSQPAASNAQSGGASTSRPAASNTQSGSAPTSRPAETSGAASSQAEKPAITLGGLPANNTVRVGDKFTLTPSEEDVQKGETGWTYDSAFFTATFNSPATFTAIKEGSSTITYTAPDGRTVSVDITIQAAGETTKPATSTTGKPTASAPGSTPKDSAIASTGDSSTVWLYAVLAAVAAALAGGLVWYKRCNQTGDKTQ